MEERNFRGIWIPSEIWLSSELSLQEKVFLVEIDSLESKECGCYASNTYFSTFFKMSTRRVAQIIASLKEKGYLSVSYKYNGKEIETRYMRINRPPYPEVVKNISVGGEKNFHGVVKNISGGSEKKCIDNNIIYNINNNTTSESAFKKPNIEEIKEYCNERNNGIEAEEFYDFYESKGWLIGKSKMKDWKACVRTWERNRKKQKAEEPINDNDGYIEFYPEDFE